MGDYASLAGRKARAAEFRLAPSVRSIRPVSSTRLAPRSRFVSRFLARTVTASGSPPRRRRPAPAASGPAPRRLQEGRLDGSPAAAACRLRRAHLAALQGVRGGRLVVVRPRSGRPTTRCASVSTRSSEVAYAEPDFFLFASAQRRPTTPSTRSSTRSSTRPATTTSTPRPPGAPAPAAPRSRSSTPASTPTTPTSRQHLQEPRTSRTTARTTTRTATSTTPTAGTRSPARARARTTTATARHVSGIVAGRGNNDTGVSGVCWSPSCSPVKFMNSQGQGLDVRRDRRHRVRRQAGHQDHQLLVRLELVSRRVARTTPSTTRRTKGVLLVVAAGNDGENIDKHPLYPASLHATRTSSRSPPRPSSDTLAAFSNYGSTGVDVAAPGDNIYSTYLGGGYKHPVGHLDGRALRRRRWPRCCASRSRTRPTATCATRSATRSTSRRRSRTRSPTTAA